MSLLEKHNHYLFGMVELINVNIYFPIFNIYGPIKIEEKILLWNEISTKIENVESNKIILAGDFNAILKLEGKSGSNGKRNRVMDGFKDFI